MQRSTELHKKRHTLFTILSPICLVCIDLINSRPLIVTRSPKTLSERLFLGVFYFYLLPWQQALFTGRLYFLFISSSFSTTLRGSQDTICSSSSFTSRSVGPLPLDSRLYLWGSRNSHATTKQPDIQASNGRDRLPCRPYMSAGRRKSAHAPVALSGVERSLSRAGKSRVADPLLLLVVVVVMLAAQKRCKRIRHRNTKDRLGNGKARAKNTLDRPRRQIRWGSRRSIDRSLSTGWSSLWTGCSWRFEGPMNGPRRGLSLIAPSFSGPIMWTDKRRGGEGGGAL